MIRPDPPKPRPASLGSRDGVLPSISAFGLGLASPLEEHRPEARRLAEAPAGAAPYRVQPPVIPSGGGRDAWSAPLGYLPEDPVAAIWSALDEVLDPELPVSLVELGLVYGVGFHGGRVEIRITFTATGCPCMDFIRADVTDRLEREPWVDSVRLEEVWHPPWTSDRITTGGRAKLRRLGVGA